MMKTTCLAALALAAGLATAATPAAAAGVDARKSAEVKVELLRGDDLAVQGSWLPRSVANGPFRPYEFSTTHTVALPTSCQPGAGGTPEVRTETVEVGTRLAIEPVSATPDGYIVNVKLNDSKLQQIRTFETNGCRISLADTEEYARQSKMDLRYGETSEFPTKFGTQQYLLRVTVGKPFALPQ
ncbi:MULTISPECIES: hypothetical protein [Cupriavidus]